VQKILQASTAAVGLAEESGYNLVAPLGYSTGDWCGSPALSRGVVKGQRSAPAEFSMNNNRPEILQKMKDVNRLVMIVKGDMDEVVPVTNTRMWVDTHEGDEAELRARGSSRGISRGSVIQTGLKPILQVFAKNTRK
jgi:hypothetical protein